MAITKFGINHPLTIKTWAKSLNAEISKAIQISALMGTDSNSIIQVKNELNKGSGDCITFGLRAQIMGSGVTDGETLEGNEEALQFLTDKLYINELFHAVNIKNKGTIDNQRIQINAREQAREALTDWYADRLSAMFFIHVCGYNAPQMDFEGHKIDLSPKYYGFNEPTPPSDKRIIRPDNKTKDEDLTDANKHKFTLALIDKAVEQAKIANPKIRPVRINGESLYVLYMHPKQVTQLRTNTDAGQWLDIQRAIYSGSRSKNPIYDGSLGMYNGVVLRESEHITEGIHSVNKVAQPGVRRAVLLGAQSAVVAFAADSAGDRFKWYEQGSDYNRLTGISAGALLGMKKTRFTTPGGKSMQDFATIVISTYVDK